LWVRLERSFDLLEEEGGRCECVGVWKKQTLTGSGALAVSLDIKLVTMEMSDVLKVLGRFGAMAPRFFHKGSSAFRILL
jgi:hypothetical protein